MKKTVFTKTYTRDNCYIIQEIWDSAYSVDFYGRKNPYLPFKINYLEDGVLEFWENLKATRWFENSLLKRNRTMPQLFDEIAREHRRIVKLIKTELKKKKLGSIGELEEFLSMVEAGTRTFLYFYHSATDSRTPKKIRNKALKMREQDAFYDDSDLIIKNTIEYLYPQTKDLAISISRKELERIPSRQTLLKRFKKCVLAIDGTRELISLEGYAAKNKRYKFEFQNISNLKIIKGQVAQPGFAKGRVRILKRKNQIKEMRNRDVLVSPMTTPIFLPAMKKASAIITDEGGITCHAAIVSRELHKPCIIGTKIATKALKDGMMVEIDANKGIIKILKNK